MRCPKRAFGLSIKVPSRDAVRNCRNGVAILHRDHSVQLGKMFVLVVLGIRQSQLPVGRALRREDMTVLAVLPTQSRNKEEVSRQLTGIAEQFGATGCQ